jgi:hypothetical protein
MSSHQDSHLRRDDPMWINGLDRRVEVTRVHTPKGARLEIRSPHFEKHIRLDALALESVSWQDESTFPLPVDASDVTLAADGSVRLRDGDGVERGRRVQIANEFAQVDATKLVAGDLEGLELRSPKLGFDLCLTVPDLESLVFQDPDHFFAFLEDPYGPEDEH